MFRRLKSDRDGYITDKVIRNNRVTDANTGQAGTLDLFKLYNESSISGETGSINEISRILIHFNFDPLRELTGSVFDVGDSSFRAILKLHDVYGGQTVPSNFNIAVFPLSKSFEEGSGFDIGSFRDLDAANFLTASQNVTWSQEGAAASGTLGDDVDIIETANLGNGLVSLVGSQFFSTGEEDLSIDITNIVSATLAGILPDYGLRISFSGTQETDQKSRFIKRFTSRHSNDPSFRPSIQVTFDDTIQDDHRCFFFDLTGTLFLQNYHLGQPANIIHNGTEITGSESIIVRLLSGSGSTFFEKVITGSQYQIGNNFQTGTYFATFAVATNETGSILNEVRLANSATFAEVWGSLDATQGFLTGTLEINAVPRTAFNLLPSRTYVNVRQNKGVYKSTEKARFHVFVQDSLERIKASKLPLEKKSTLFKEMFYQIRDSNSNSIIIPFHNPGTKLSVNDNGMHFDLFMSDLYIGRSYGIEVKYVDRGIEKILGLNEVGAVFRVEV